MCEKLDVTENGPHPTLPLPLDEDVEKCIWISDDSPSISRTTFAAKRNANADVALSKSVYGQIRGYAHVGYMGNISYLANSAALSSGRMGLVAW